MKAALENLDPWPHTSLHTSSHQVILSTHYLFCLTCKCVKILPLNSLVWVSHWWSLWIPTPSAITSVGNNFQTLWIPNLSPSCLLEVSPGVLLAPQPWHVPKQPHPFLLPNQLCLVTLLIIVPYLLPSREPQPSATTSALRNSPVKISFEVKIEAGIWGSSSILKSWPHLSLFWPVQDFVNIIFIQTTHMHYLKSNSLTTYVMKNKLLPASFLLTSDAYSLEVITCNIFFPVPSGVYFHYCNFRWFSILDITWISIGDALHALPVPFRHFLKHSSSLPIAKVCIFVPENLWALPSLTGERRNVPEN